MDLGLSFPCHGHDCRLAWGHGNVAGLRERVEWACSLSTEAVETSLRTSFARSTREAIPSGWRLAEVWACVDANQLLNRFVRDAGESGTA